jgi:GDSL-like Lipase/Acylhydrolase family
MGQPSLARCSGDLVITIKKVSKFGGPFRIVYGFDSISNFVWVAPKTPNSSVGPWFADSLQKAMIAALSVNYRGVPGGGPTDTGNLAWFNSGVSGDDCTNVVGNVGPRVNAFQPDLLIMWVGVNCVQHSVSDATCLANHASIIAQAKAFNPQLQVIAMSPLCIGENWPRGANANDTALDAKAAIVQSTVQAAGGTYVDLRTPMFAYEAINNPGHLTILGPLTNNDASAIHPNDVGRAFLSGVMMPFFQFSIK